MNFFFVEICLSSRRQKGKRDSANHMIDKNISKTKTNKKVTHLTCKLSVCVNFSLRDTLKKSYFFKSCESMLKSSKEYSNSSKYVLYLSILLVYSIRMNSRIYLIDTTLFPKYSDVLSKYCSAKKKRSLTSPIRTVVIELL